MINQTQNPCKLCGNVGTEQHHMYPRGSSPELIDDPKNLLILCHSCHDKATNNQDVLKSLQEIFYNWRPANLDLFLRAQATIESIEAGQGWEFFTPAMVDSTLKLATAQYAYLNDKMSLLEQQEARFYGGLLGEEKMSKNRMEMEWRVTPEGQEMIALDRKIKVLEKIGSAMKASLRRLEIERFNTN